MSFNNSSKEIPPSSNHSLFTPSYNDDFLVPIQCQELDLEPSLPITPKILEKPASSVKSYSSTPKPRNPIQYQKLKMNYLRKLNVVPIVSQKDVLATLGNEASSLTTKSNKASTSSLTPEKTGQNTTKLEKSRNIEKAEKTSKKKLSNSKKLEKNLKEKAFTPSFLPTNNVTSKPITIPPRSSSKKLPDLSLYEELEKGEISSSTPHPRSASLIPDHFGVFFRDFEL